MDRQRECAHIYGTFGQMSIGFMLWFHRCEFESNKGTNRTFCFLFMRVYIQEQMSSDANVHIDIDTYTRVFTYA